VDQQFAALRDGSYDPGTLKLNHAIHTQPIRRSPNGPVVNLDCGDCHRPAAVKTNWIYADERYGAAQPSYSEEEEIHVVKANNLTSHAPVTGRELMAPVKFGTACSSCHLLTFDKRFEEGVPHDKPEIIHAFVVKKLRDYIAAHPAKVRVIRETDRELAGRPILPEARILTPEQWVAERSTEDEHLLWRKTCQECHTLRNVPPGAGNDGAMPASGTTSHALPEVEASNTTVRWMPHAKFDHDAHRGFTCVSCHQNAVSSTDAKRHFVAGNCNLPDLPRAGS